MGQPLALSATARLGPDGVRRSPGCNQAQFFEDGRATGPLAWSGHAAHVDVSPVSAVAGGRKEVLPLAQAGRGGHGPAGDENFVHGGG